MKKSILISILVITVSLASKAQFTVMPNTITGTTASLWSSVFTDDTTGYVVGGFPGVSGVILKTTDAGASWSITSTTSSLNSVFFSSKDIGYAVGEGTTVMKTIDGGVNWVYQNTSVIPPTYTASAVCFINNDTGFVGFTNAAPYAFLKTYDGGVTWINDVSDTLLIESMFVVKQSNTVFAINDKLARTTDIGNTWTKQSLLPLSQSTSMYFFNDSVGFVVMRRYSSPLPCSMYYSTIAKTIDGGQTWSSTDFYCQNWFSTIVFPSNSIGYMLAPGKLYKTTDGGNTWNYVSFTYVLDSTQQANNITGYYLTCTDTNTCYIFTNDGTIIKTTNGGGNVGINESVTNIESLNIYPNPATNQIIIEFELTETQNVFLEIKNVLGQTAKVVSNNSISKGNNKIEIDVSEFSNGIYFVQLQNGNKPISKKFIKR